MIKLQKSYVFKDKQFVKQFKILKSNHAHNYFAFCTLSIWLNIRYPVNVESNHLIEDDYL